MADGQIVKIFSSDSEDPVISGISYNLNWCRIMGIQHVPGQLD